MDRPLNKKLLVLLIFVVLLALSTPVVEAGVGDNIKATWGNMRVYVISGAFWINTVLVFAALFIAYNMLLKDKVGKDTFQKVIMVMIIVVIALALATKIVDDNNNPQFIWKVDNFKKATRFFLGDSTQNIPRCDGKEHSFPRALLSMDPNPSCCGTGAYEFSVHGSPKCRQGILRVNENGSGLFAFILASILFLILFSAYGKELGFKDMGGKSGEWIPRILAILLGALMANSRVTKNNLVMIGGWVLVVLIGLKLSKNLSGDAKVSKKGFGFGLAFALVQLVANMLGTTLWGGGYVDPATINMGTIIFNILKGMCVGWGWAILTKSKSSIGDILNERAKKKKKDIKEHMKKHEWWKAIRRWLPLLGNIWDINDRNKKKRERADIEKDIKDLEKEQTHIGKRIDNLSKGEGHDKLILSFLNNEERIRAKIKQLRKELEKKRKIKVR